MPNSANSRVRFDPTIPEWKLRRLAELKAELAARQAASLDVFGVLGYTPNVKQAEFHAADETDVLYGGAAGGGKTKALLMEGLRACVRHPGIRVVAVRETYKELAESFGDELSRIGYARDLGATWSKSEFDLNFANGSIIRFRHCAGLEDAKIRLGSEIQLLLVDEAVRQEPAAVDFLKSRLRSSNPAIPVLGVRMGSNPSGVGHGWLKARYVDATGYGLRTVPEVVDGTVTGNTIRFIPARYTDNPHINYERQLNAIEDPRLRAAYRDGNWDVFEGQVFIEWERDRHVCRPFTIPDSWVRYAGVDWGYADPWAVVWGAVDEDRRVWIYRELYARQVGESDQARRILAAEGALVDGQIAIRPAEQVRMRLADPSMWNTRGEVNPISAVYHAQGCVIHPATNDRLAGWQRVHSYLDDGPACRMHREKGWTTCPRLHVFDTCTDLIRTLPELPADLHNPEDVDTHAEDHAADALRYLLMQLGVPRGARQQADPPASFDERIWELKAKRDRDRGRARRNTHDVLGSM